MAAIVRPRELNAEFFPKGLEDSTKMIKFNACKSYLP